MEVHFSFFPIYFSPLTISDFVWGLIVKKPTCKTFNVACKTLKFWKSEAIISYDSKQRLHFPVFCLLSQGRILYFDRKGFTTCGKYKHIITDCVFELPCWERRPSVQCFLVWLLINTRHFYFYRNKSDSTVIYFLMDWFKISAESQTQKCFESLQSCESRTVELLTGFAAHMFRL